MDVHAGATVLVPDDNSRDNVGDPPQSVDFDAPDHATDPVIARRPCVEDSREPSAVGAVCRDRP